MNITVAAFSGSLRRESYTTKLLKAFQELAPQGVTMKLIDISNLPLINEDLEADLPQSVRDLHQSVTEATAILLGTPEYNRSYSPVIKNALDWGSRPDGVNAWDGKPTAVIGCTPYSLGAFGAVHHLRQVLTYLNMPTMQQPEFYTSNAGSVFAADGKVVDESAREHIEAFWTAFVAWIQHFDQA